MKISPILFSGPMVRAILDGRKTQTRRVVNPQPQPNGGEGLHPIRPYQTARGKWTWVIAATGMGDGTSGDWCPHGHSGDLIWVREEHYRFGNWHEVPGVKTKGGRQKWRFVGGDSILFEPPAEFRKGRHTKDPYTPAWHKRLGRFMPRVASRITLEITDVRLERLQNCSEADALAEGATPGMPYGTIWKKINTEPGIRWEDNPWVWALTFKVHHKNVDDFLKEAAC